MNPQEATDLVMILIPFVLLIGVAAMIIMLNMPMGSKSQRAPLAAAKTIKVVNEPKDDLVLSHTMIEGFNNYSDIDKQQIIDALRQGAKFGRSNLGPMHFDINTGRKIN